MNHHMGCTTGSKVVITTKEILSFPSEQMKLKFHSHGNCILLISFSAAVGNLANNFLVQSVHTTQINHLCLEHSS